MDKKDLKNSIKKMTYYLQFYDDHGFFPFEKKRVDITLSGEALKRLEGKNRSLIIEKLILNRIKKMAS